MKITDDNVSVFSFVPPYSSNQTGQHAFTGMTDVCCYTYTINDLHEFATEGNNVHIKIDEEMYNVNIKKKEETAANDALKADTARLTGVVQQVMKLQSAVEKLGSAMYQPTALGAIQEFLRETGLGVNGVDKVGPEGTTALIMVCKQGKLMEVKGLVEVGGADVNLEALSFVESVPGKHVGKASSAWKAQRTPLMAATLKGDVEIVGYLISKGADPNKAMTDTGTTPLLVAAKKRSLGDCDSACRQMCRPKPGKYN